MNKQQEPRLRFRGFTGGWEEKKIGEIFNVTSGTTPLRSNQNYFSNGVINWVKTTDLNNSILDKTEEQISEIALNETSLKVLPKNTLFVAMYGGFNQIGRTGLLNMEATCNQALAAILPDKSQNPFYLLTYLNYSVEYWKGIAASSRKDPNITKQDVLDFECFFPALLEQTHLGLFFRRLDSQIAESRAVLEKSRQLKKAMLAKMFPANGEKIPKIRFKGFEGEWEEKKLGDVLSIKSGMSQKDIEVSDGIYPILATGGEIGRTNTALYDKESVLIGRKGTIDKPYYMNTPFWTVDTLFYSELKDNVDGKFLYFLFQCIEWRRLDTSTGVPSLTSTTIHEIQRYFPKKEEQTAIGNFFRQLDETIALQSAEVEKLNQLKKGLLAAMLV